MTEREAREMLDEIRTVRPRKRYKNTIFEIEPDGRIGVWLANLKGTRAVFSHYSGAESITFPREIREWIASRWDAVDQARKEARIAREKEQAEKYGYAYRGES